MHRVMIIGSCGAGKSTLAFKLRDITGLDLIHLDQHFWSPDWVEPDKAEWKETVKELASRDQWIIDGNYSSTLDIRLVRADTVIYLNYPTLICLWRVLKRVYKYRGQVRPDMAKGCPEKFDLDFLHYVVSFRMRRAKMIAEKLAKIKATKRVIELKTSKEVDNLLSHIAQQKAKP